MQSLLDSALHDVQGNSDHKLLPYKRKEIYTALRKLSGIPIPEVGWHASLEKPDFVSGYLGYITASKVVHLWTNMSPLWPDEPVNDPDWVASFKLGDFFLEVIRGFLCREISEEQAQNKMNQYWHVSGNIDEEIFYFRKATLETGCGFHALSSSYSALYDTFCLSRTELYLLSPSDDDVMLFQDFSMLDSAGSACLAITGAEDYAKPEIEAQELRLNFWTWWLTEAIPLAIKFGEENNVLR